MKVYKNLFSQIIALENLFSAWQEFHKDKRRKTDVQEFEFDREQHIFQLHRDLTNKTYKHGPYTGFYICDPKVRHIHKATVRDRVLHHAVFRILNPIFEPTFIPNSFSCRVGKGTHKGVLAIETMARKVSRNYTRPCFALKCDVKKFFDSVDHGILMGILSKKVVDEDTRWLLKEIIGSYTSGQLSLFDRKGLPIGNLTSQLFANVYMNEFDQFIKNILKVERYARYTDDFIIVSGDKSYLENLLGSIQNFLHVDLALKLHPNKIAITKLHRGIDFLGYVVLSHHRLLRAKMKRRIPRKIKERIEQFKRGMISEITLEQSLRSYLGVLCHADTYRFTQDLKNNYWFWMSEK